MANDKKENTKVETNFEELTADEKVNVLQAALATEQAGRENAETALANEIAAHEESNKKSLEVIGGIKAKLEVTTEIAKAGKALTVTHKNKEYKILINSFKLDGIVYTGADLKEKPEIVEKLIKLGSGVLSN